MLNKKIARSLASCAVILLLLINCTSCLSFTLSGIGGGGVSAPDGCYIDGKKYEISSPEKESRLYRNMSDEEKLIYNAAYTALSDGYNEFVLKNVDHQKILDIYGDVLKALISDFPEFFWLSGYVKANAEYVSGSDKGNVTVSMGIYDYWLENDLAKARKEFNENLNNFLREAREIQDDWESIRFVHDRIIDMTAYDDESYELGEASNAMMNAYSNSAYGPLVEGIALCGGYAKLFELVMHRLGFECEYITGTADGGSHAWNLILLDNGDYYHVDLTWDDPDREDGIILYNYFCVNDEMIAKTHTVDPEYEDIKASSTKYNYHVYKSLYLTAYDFEALENIVKSHSSEKTVSVRFENKEAFESAISELIDGYKFFDILEKIDKESFSYIQNDELYILVFIME